MIQLLHKEIQNLKLVIDDCLNDVGDLNPNNPVITVFHNKYDYARGKMNKSCNVDFYMGQCLAYKEILGMLGVKV